MKGNRNRPARAESLNREGIAKRMSDLIDDVKRKAVEMTREAQAASSSAINEAESLAHGAESDARSAVHEADKHPVHEKKHKHHDHKK